MVGPREPGMDNHHGHGGSDHINEEDDGEENKKEEVGCSICLELVLDNVGRSRAKLQCGHEFHLDCIGSAFNMKGCMQCPNCRNIEKGRWFYANGSSRSLHGLIMDDFIPDEDFYELGHPQMHYRFHWCPFGELARSGSSFEEVEPASTTYHDLIGHHSTHAQTTATSSTSHLNAPYSGPVQQTSLDSNDTTNASDVNNHQNDQSRHTRFLNHHLPAINIHHRSWGHHSLPFFMSNNHVNSAEAAAVPRVPARSGTEQDAGMRSAVFAHPLHFGHGPCPVSGASLASAVVPQHPTGSAQIQERIPFSHAVHHRLQSSSSGGMPSHVVHGITRFEGPRGFSGAVPTLPQHDHGGGFFVIPSLIGPFQRDTESSAPHHFHAW